MPDREELQQETSPCSVTRLPLSSRVTPRSSIARYGDAEHRRILAGDNSKKGMSPSDDRIGEVVPHGRREFPLTLGQFGLLMLSRDCLVDAPVRFRGACNFPRASPEYPSGTEIDRYGPADRQTQIFLSSEGDRPRLKLGSAQ
jgi:hypothetical protein